MIGTTYKHYRIESLLGRGGMGEVYRARDTRLERPVAIKVMSTRDQGGRLVDRFIKEARSASALNHPNIVTVHEIIETETGELLMVQEFVEGRTLRELLRSAIPLDRALDIVRQLTKALAAAHQAGIIHRDIKPENVMVRPDGYVKLLDFGLARSLTTDSTETVAEVASQLTAAGTILGTTMYMSPEQGSGRTVDCPSDVFSLGIVFYEMLTGQRPFRGDVAPAIIHAIMTEHPAPPSRVNVDVPQALDSVVLAMLAKDPAVRPSAAAVDADLGLALGVTIPAAAPRPVVVRHMVGRDAERRRLAALLDDASADRGLIAAVVGEPGIGKTSVVDETLAELERGPHRPVVARGKCSERLAGTEAYLPVLEVIDNLLHASTAGGFAEMLRTIAPTWFVQVAPLSSTNTAAIQIQEDTRTASQERMKRELAAFLAEVSRVRPLVLFIEDLHWADPSTVDALNYVAGRFDGMRLLIITTYRASEMALAKHPFLQVADHLRTTGALVELSLESLGRSDVQRYLALEFPGHDLPEEFVTLIHQKTEGHPLFMVDLVRYLRDRGDVVEDSGRWALRRSMADIAGELPESARSTIARKIDRLTEDDRKLLTVASVQGHEFDTLVVSDVLGLDPADVEDRFSEIHSVHRLIVPVRTSEFPDGGLSVRYRFAHVLYQNVLYASLQPTRRASFARKVAQALVAHHGSAASELALELALLYETARDAAASAQQFTVAAHHAVGIFGFTEALSLADRGLAMTDAMPDGPERRQRELQLLMIKGTALRSATGWATPALDQTFARARVLCHELGDPPQVFPVLWATTLFHLIRGNLIECRARADELMAQTANNDNRALRLGAYHMAGVAREFIGEMVAASERLEHARELHVPAEHRMLVGMYGTDPGIMARAMSSRPLWALGYPDRAVERARETVTIARLHPDPPASAFAMMVLLGILAYRGDGEQALAVGNESIALCREHGLPQEAEWSRSFQGAALIGLGRTGEGIDLLTDSLAVQLDLDTQLARPMFLALLADGFRRADRMDEGLESITEGIAWAERTSERGYLAELHRVRGEILRRAGDRSGGEASLREALAIAQAQQARSLELRAVTGLAALLHETGRTSEARAALAPMYEWFTEGLDTADLKAARTLLSEMG